MEVLERANQLQQCGRPVIHLEVGEPDFPTPEPVCAAGIRAIRDGKTRYTEALGIPALREQIAAHYPVECRPASRRIAVVPGSSAALQIVFAALLEPGDQVLMSDPGYPCNANFVHLYDGDPVRVTCGPEDGYQLSPCAIRAHWGDRTRAVLLGSPANPTGTAISPECLSEIAQTVRELGGTLIVDEIYHGLVYDTPVRSALCDGTDIFVVNSFSKYFGMTGWRLGWLVVPDAYLDAVAKLCQNLFISAPTVAQYAALAAFEPHTRAELDRRRDEFQRRRDFLVPELRALGFVIPRMPDGAFYVYADVTRFTDNSSALAAELLERIHVAITPGRDFGEFRQREHVRFSYANTRENLEEALRRLVRVLA
jgi:aspartate/methionine/tyrosine aminotransferase